MILKENYSIKNSLQINSVADYGAEIDNLHDLDKLFRFINDKCLNYFILGEGTKLTGDNLFEDMEPGKTDANARYIGLIVDGVDITPRLRLLTTPYS